MHFGSGILFHAGATGHAAGCPVALRLRFGILKVPPETFIETLERQRKRVLDELAKQDKHARQLTLGFGG